MGITAKHRLMRIEFPPEIGLEYTLFSGNTDCNKHPYFETTEAGA